MDLALLLIIRGVSVQGNSVETSKDPTNAPQIQSSSKVTTKKWLPGSSPKRPSKSNPQKWLFEPKRLGRDMGGCKTYGGWKTYQRTRSPENFWTPPKELLVCSVVVFCTGKTECWHLRGVENVPYEGGSKAPFWKGCHSWGFPPPSFFHPPMASSEKVTLGPLFSQRVTFRVTFWVTLVETPKVTC